MRLLEDEGQDQEEAKVVRREHQHGSWVEKLDKSEFVIVVVVVVVIVDHRRRKEWW